MAKRWSLGGTESPWHTLLKFGSNARNYGPWCRQMLIFGVYLFDTIINNATIFQVQKCRLKRITTHITRTDSISLCFESSLAVSKYEMIDACTGEIFRWQSVWEMNPYISPLTIKISVSLPNTNSGVLSTLVESDFEVNFKFNFNFTSTKVIQNLLWRQFWSLSWSLTQIIISWMSKCYHIMG